MNSINQYHRIPQETIDYYLRDKLPTIKECHNQEIQHEKDIQNWENEGGSVSHINLFKIEN
jgi:hypothetical protein